MTKRPLLKLIRSLLEDPPILADWLDDFCIADQQWLGEIQKSLRSDSVICKAFGYNWERDGRYDTFSQTDVKWKHVNPGNSVFRLKLPPSTLSPVMQQSREHLCMECDNYLQCARWLFYPPSRAVGVLNPLLFGLCCIQYGWSRHPIVNTVMQALIVSRG